MALTSINVVLPEPLVEYVEQRVEYGEFSSPSEFVQTLIYEDRDRRMVALEDELEAAMNTGRVSVSHDELVGGKLIALLKERRSQLR